MNSNNENIEPIFITLKPHFEKGKWLYEKQCPIRNCELIHHDGLEMGLKDSAGKGFRIIKINDMGELG